MFRTAAAISRERNDAILAVLGDDERAVLAHMLDKILAGLDTAYEE